MRPSLEPGFMKSGFFKWPERETIEIKCLGCPIILKVKINGNRQKWCKDCIKERKRLIRRKHYKKYGNAIRKIQRNRST